MSFNKNKLDGFLGVVRKYMQMRGNLSQKDLAEKIEVGVSTVSRFLNKKTNELDPHIISLIVAKLEIPLHEAIDFVEDDFTEKFKRLVAFHKGVIVPKENPDETGTYKLGEINDLLGSLGTPEKDVKAKPNHLLFENDKNGKSLREKLEELTPRQKAYLTEFLNLDIEGRDLMVDLGNSLFRYFRQKGMES